MRLIKLDANKKSFKTIEFNRTGLSLILAQKDDSSESGDSTKTYNGLGKSLSLAIIHYCLGTNKNNAFVQHLPGWEFYLTVEIDGVNRVISRGTEDKNTIKLDDEEISLAKLREFLQQSAFGHMISDGSLSFRSMVNRFIRVGRESYNTFLNTSMGDQMKPYQCMMRIAYLLGLDLNIARKKQELRSRETGIKNTMDQLESDPLFSELLAGDTVEIEIASLQDEASELRADLNSFRVADDYTDIERDADSTKRRLGKARRSASKLHNAIEQINRSLETKSDLPADRVVALYEEMDRSLPDLLKRRMSEVVDFQNELQRKRVFRLSQEKQKLRSMLASVQNEVTTISDELDAKLRYLNDHRALDEYVTVSEKYTELEKQIAKFVESKRLRDTVNKERQAIARDMATGNLEADEYLESVIDLNDEAMAMFRGFATSLYGKRKCGLSISNDSGINQTRYKIEAYIAGDAAEGINEAKIFCFDLMLLALGRGHKIQFLVHDSTLFSPIDPRQRYAMFRIAHEVCNRLGLQYIATLNYHDVPAMSDLVGVEASEHEELFGASSVVLRLTDKSPESKLLGIDVEMDYA